MLQRRIEKMLKFFKRWNPQTMLAAVAWSCAVLGGNLLGTHNALAQIPTITEVLPASPLDLNSNVQVTFSTAMDTGTLTVNRNPNLATVNFYSQLRGYLSTKATVTYRNGNREVWLNPDVNFLPGEEFTLSVNDPESSGGVALARPQVFQFRSKSDGGTAVFSHATQHAATSSASVVLADFDNDGDIDAFFANRNGAANSIWKNNGRGSFSHQTRGNGDSRGVAAGDLDGDGDMDVVVANYDAETQIFRNYLGNFSFYNIAGTGNSTDVAIGDLDGDGDLDIYEANTNGQADRILFNNGNATFTTSTFGNFNSESLAIGDVDGDGALDVLVGVSGGSNRLLTNDIHNGGLFSESTLGGEPYGATIADFNNDGTPETYFAPAGTDNVIVADFNFDQNLDRILVDSDGVQTLHMNDGSGVFTAGTFGDATSGSIAGAAADLDADGDLDFLMATDGGNQNQIWSNATTPGPRIVETNPSTNATAYPNGGDITIRFSERIDASTLKTGVSAANVNLTIWGSQTGYDTAANIALDANGTVATITPNRHFLPGEKITIGVKGVRSDATGGYMPHDISWEVWRETNFGSGAWQSQTFGMSGNYTDVTLGDLDGDGDLDALFLTGHSQITMWKNDGDANFATSTFGLGNVSGTAVADLDEDGDLDIIGSRFYVQNVIYWNNGDATFTEELIGDYSGESSCVNVGDFNNDGLIDIIVGAENLDNDEVYWNNGDGTFRLTHTGGGTRTTDLYVGDLESDGDIDIVTATRLMWNARYRNNGNEGFRRENFERSDNYSRYSLMGDFDGDGVIEVFTGNTWDMEQGDFNADGFMDQFHADGASRVINYNNGDGTFNSVNYSYYQADARGVAIGDLDGDGDLDALTANFRNWMGNVIFLQSGTPKFKRSVPPNGGYGKRSGTVDVVFSDWMKDIGFDHLNQTLHLKKSMSASTEATVTLNDLNGRIFIDPDERFAVGERVMVTVKSGSESLDGKVNATSATFTFNAEAFTGTGTFTTQTIGSNSDGLVAADFNGDGLQDIFLADTGGHKLLTGNGDGTFTSTDLGFGTDKYPAAGDFNNDGHLDLIVVGDGADEILLNNGSGSFSRSTIAGDNSTDVDLGDLDGDGDLDAIVTENGAKPKILTNDGSGTFSSAEIAGVYQATGVVIADLDNDGDLDVAISRDESVGASQIRLLNRGDGTFQTSARWAARATDVDAGDFDLDGDVDLIYSTITGSQMLFTNNGDATFDRTQFGGGTSSGVEVCDLDGDNDPDIIVTNAAGTDDEIWINDGTGTFVINSFDNPADGKLQAVDVDGDRDLDIVALDADGPAQLWLNIDPIPKVVSLSPSTNANAIARSGDIDFSFNYDINSTTLNLSTLKKYRNLTVQSLQRGNLSTQASVTSANSHRDVKINPDGDFLPGEELTLTIREVQSSGKLYMADPKIVTYRAAVDNGSASFYAQFMGAAAAQNLAVGDLNKDGHLDVILPAQSGQSELWFGNGDGTFSITALAGNGYKAVDIADFEGDGDLDVILTTNGSGLSDTELLLNNGDGTFTSNSLSGANAISSYFVDTNGDGDLDIIRVEDGAIGHQEQLDDGSLITKLVYGGTTVLDAAIGDVNGDGLPDLFIARGSGGASRLMLNDGDHNFSLGSDFNVDASHADMADLNGDGINDLVFITNSTYDFTDGGASEGIAIWTGNGDGTFSQSVVTLPRTFNSFAFGDLDADGDLEIVLSGTSGADRLMINNGNATFKQRDLSTNSSKAVAMGDIDSDGNLDLLLARDSGAATLLNLLEPEISATVPNNVIAQTSTLNVSVSGTDLYATAANITTLHPDGTPKGIAHLTVSSASLTHANVVLPAGLVSTVGTVTLNLITGAGTTSTTIEVLNDQPLIVTDNTVLATDEDTATTICLSLADISPGIGGLTVTPPAADGVTIASIVQQGATAATTKFLVTPVPNQSGTVELNFTVSDGDLSSVTTLTLSVQPVNDPPTVASTNTVLVTDEDTPPTTWVNIADIDNPLTALSLSVTSNNQSLVTNGGIVVPTTASALTPIHINPLTNINGSSDITIFVNDGEYTRSTTFSLTVNPVNDPPTISTGNTALNLLEDEDGSLWIDLGDIDNSFNELQLTATSNNQSLLTDANLTIVTPTSATTRIDFDPTDNANGSALLTVTVDDGQYQRTTTFNLNVSPVNDVPQIGIANTIYTIDEDGSTSLQISVLDLDDPLSNVVITAQSDNTSLLALNGINIATPTTASTQIDLTPLADQNGSAVVTITADDGTIPQTTSFTLIVNPVNDAPVISAVNDVTIDQNGVETVNFSLTDIDNSVTSLMVSVSSSNLSLIDPVNQVFSATAANMSLTLNPECDQSGVADLFITVDDGTDPITSSFEVTVNALLATTVNGQDDICPFDEFNYNVSPSVPGASHTWSIQGGTILAGQNTENVIVEWEASTNGSLSVLRTWPNGCTTQSALPITSKTGIQTAMDFSSIAGQSSTSIAVLNNDSGNSLTLQSVETPSNGTVTVNNGIVTYTADSGFSGIETFAYIASDHEGCSATGAIVVVVSAAQTMVNMHYIETLKDRVNGVRGLNSAGAVTTSPDGKYVYAAGRSDNSIAIFSSDQVSGTLTYQGRIRDGYNGVDGLKYVMDVAVSPDGKNLYAAGYGENELAVFRIETDGSLTYLEQKKNGAIDFGLTTNGLSAPRAVTVSPDGRNVYVAAYKNNAISVFKRDITDGKLRFVEYHKDGVNGVDGLKYVLDLTLSPDGKNLYAAGYGDKSVAMFTRNLLNGTLNYLERVKDGVNGVDGIGGARAVAVSPDGKQIYAAGYSDDAIAVFNRSGSGTMTYLEKHRDGSTAPTGLDGAGAVQVSPDGRHVWVAAQLDDAVTLFQRNSDGSLKVIETQFDNSGQVNYLKKPVALALSPNSQYLYCAAWTDDAITCMFRNQVPVAQDDAGVNVAKNTTISMDVLLNDSDADGHTMLINSDTDGVLGTVAITGGGTTLEYMAGNTTGADQFTYTINDGHGGSSTATVSIVVQSAKSALPLAENGVQSLQDNSLTIAPNPVNVEMRISLALAEQRSLVLTIVDVTGRSLFEVHRGTVAAGQSEINWTLTNELKQSLPSGQYMLMLETIDAATPLQITQPFLIVH